MLPAENKLARQEEVKGGGDSHILLIRLCVCVCVCLCVLVPPPTQNRVVFLVSKCLRFKRTNKKPNIHNFLAK